MTKSVSSPRSEGVTVFRGTSFLNVIDAVVDTSQNCLIDLVENIFSFYRRVTSSTSVLTKRGALILTVTTRLFYLVDIFFRSTFIDIGIHQS